MCAAVAFPTKTMRSPRIATSAARPGLPVPSTTVPPRTRMSAESDFCACAVEAETEATTTLAQITDTSRAAGRDFGMMSAASELWKRSSRPCCSRDDIVLFGPNIVRLVSFALGDRICNRGREAGSYPAYDLVTTAISIAFREEGRDASLPHI